MKNVEDELTEQSISARNLVEAAVAAVEVEATALRRMRALDAMPASALGEKKRGEDGICGEDVTLSVA